MFRFDVIVPCYNYGRYLRACVQSVLDQPGVSVRVLILDDCSPDNTPEVGRALASEDSRVEFRRHAVNERHVATYNEGLAWSQADATVLLSADDLLTPGALGRAAEILRCHADVGLVWGRQIVFDQMPPPAPSAANWTYAVVPGAEFVEQMCSQASNPVNTPTAVTRTSVMKQVGRCNAALPHTNDMEFWLRMAARASVAIIDANQAYKRMHGQNMQVEFVARVLPDLEQRLAAVQSFLEVDGGRVQSPQRLQRLASRAVGANAFWAASKAFDRGDVEQCRVLLEAACRWWPELPSTPDWSRLAWKRRLGSRVWRTVQPVVDRLRRVPQRG